MLLIILTLYTYRNNKYFNWYQKWLQFVINLSFMDTLIDGTHLSGMSFSTSNMKPTKRRELLSCIKGVALLFALLYECSLRFSGVIWHFDERENDCESTRWLEKHKGATRHPRGACGNAAWRLHYFWGEKCPFLLEDSSPRATRARLVKILRTAYKLDRGAFLSPFPFHLSPSPSLSPSHRLRGLLPLCSLLRSPFHLPVAFTTSQIVEKGIEKCIITLCCIITMI